MAEQNDERLLLRVDIDYDQLTAKIAKAKQSIGSLKEENKKLTDQANKALKEGAVAQYDELNKKIVQNEAVIRSLSTEQKSAQKTQDLLNLSNKAAAGSYEQLLRQQQLAQTNLKLLEGTLKKNADGTFVLTEQYKHAAQEVKTAKEAIIAFDQGIKDGRTNVGNYASSLGEALERSGLFGQSLGIIREGFNGLKAGQQIVTEGFHLMKAGIEGANAGFKNILGSLKAVPAASEGVKNAAEGVTEIAQAAESVGSSAPKIEQVGAVGARAFNIIKIAIASTGIGLLLVALGSLVAFFQKSEAASELLGRTWAGLKAIVSVLTNDLADFGEIIFNAFKNPKQALMDLISFIGDNFLNRLKAFGVILDGLINYDASKVANGFVQLTTGVEDAADKMGNYAKKTADAAAEAFKLEGAQQQLEDRIRQTAVEINANNNAISKALKLSKDATVSLKDRKKALEEAGELEKRNALLEAGNAKEQLALDVKKVVNAKNLTDAEKERFRELTTSQTTLNDLQQAELDLLQEKGKISDDELQDIVDTAIEKNNIIAENQEKRLLIDKRYNKFLQDEQRKSITATVGILEDELRLKELQGQKDFNLRRDIARKQTAELLLNDELVAEERARIRSGLRLKLAEIEKAESDFILGLKQQQEDALLSTIINTRDREIATEATQLQRKLAAITGNSQQEKDLRTQLVEQSALKIQEIEAKFAEETLAKLTAAEEKRKQKELAGVNSRLTETQNALRLALANEEITQEQFEQQKNDALLEAQATELAILEQSKANKLALIEQTYAEEQAKNLAQKQAKEIDEKTFNDKMVEIDAEKNTALVAAQDEFGQQITEKQNALSQSEQNIAIQNAENRKAIAKKLSDFKQQLANVEIDTALAVVGALRGALAAEAKERKGLAFVLKGLALAEIGINLQKELSANAVTAAQNPLNGPTFGAAGIAQLAALNTASAVRAAIAGATVLIQKFKDGGLTMDDAGGSMPKGPAGSLMEVMNQYSPSVYNDFAGGMVYGPTLWPAGPGKANLAGEAGPEWVASNWMLADPVAGPLINSLEVYRKTKYLPFADGGFTVSAALGTPSIFNQLTAEDLVNAFQSLPPSITYIEDIKDANDRINKTESRANS
jgi:hypothetical protein